MKYSDKPWLKSYNCGPYKLKQTMEPYPRVPVFKALDDAAEKFAGKTAIQMDDQIVTYGKLKEQSEKLTSAFRKLDVNVGDKVCIFLPNCIEFIVSDWAVLKAGAATVPTSTMRTDEGLIHEAGSSKSKIIICIESHLERVLAVKDKCGIEHIIVTPDDGYINGELKSADLPSGVHDFKKLLAESDGIAPDVKIDPENHLCELAFTGGATGVPKGVMTTHFNRYTNLIQGLPWLLEAMSRGIIGKSSILITIPLFHSYGHALVHLAAFWGMRILLAPDPRDIDYIVSVIKEYRPFLIPTIPTQLMMMAKSDIGRMNSLFFSGSAPLPDSVREVIMKEMGNPIGEGYGLTETGPIAHLNPSAFSKITGFMSKEKRGLGIPVPDTECKIIDLETGEDVPFGESGEILLRGPQIMKGYWPDASGLTEDRWFHTGDIGYMDEEGFFYINDRVKDMINVSGLKVYSTKVDDVLFKHPGIQMAVAIGVPDPEREGSERVMAIIRLKEEFAGKISGDDIISFCREHLAPYEVPKFIEFKDDLPLTVTGKLWKKELRDEMVEKMKG